MINGWPRLLAPDNAKLSQDGDKDVLGAQIPPRHAFHSLFLSSFLFTFLSNKYVFLWSRTAVKINVTSCRQREKGHRDLEAVRGSDFVASLMSLWPSLFPSTVAYTVCHTVWVLSKGRQERGRNKIKSVIIFLFAASSILGLTINLQGQACTMPVSKSANINGKHTNRVLNHTPYFDFFLCTRASVPLRCPQIWEFLLEAR